MRCVSDHLTSSPSGLIFVTLSWFVFASLVDSRSVEASVTKPTVCTITIHSSEEKEVFQAYLGEDFKFVELTNFANHKISILKTQHGDIPTRFADKRWFVRAC